MSYNVTIFGIHLKLSPIAFSIPIGSGHWDIYWYGIIIATGFLLALIYGLKNAPRYGLNSDRMLDVILVATPVAILSARTYYVIFDGEKLNGIGDFFGFGRGFIELLRTDSLMIGNLKVSCLLSFLISIAAFSALAVLRNRYKENSGSADYEEVFTDNGEPDAADDLKEEENEQNN